jgi:hypothetical protein
LPVKGSQVASDQRAARMLMMSASSAIRCFLPQVVKRTSTSTRIFHQAYVLV